MISTMTYTGMNTNTGMARHDLLRPLVFRVVFQKAFNHMRATTVIIINIISIIVIIIIIIISINY